LSKIVIQILTNVSGFETSTAQSEEMKMMPIIKKAFSKDMIEILTYLIANRISVELTSFLLIPSV